MMMAEKITAARAMRLAIEEGRKGTGFVAPNPLVGCTILDRNFRLLAVGYHRRVGFDHAEIDALKKIEDRSLLQGAHVFVTLEPCAHQGRTPSCARTLAPLGIASLTYAVEDPNPLVAGKGAQILREAGVQVSLLSERTDLDADEARLLTAEAEELAEIFLHNMRAKEPFVAVKVASTLDGKMALASGESKWITGESSREHVHFLRAGYDAVLVGRQTVMADDPSLNVRHRDFPGFSNKAVILDPRGQTLVHLSKSNLLKVRDPESVFVVVSDQTEVSNPLGVRIIRVAMQQPNSFDVKALLQSLKVEGLSSVMIEGGAHAVGAFFSARKVQRLHLFIAPTLLGGRSGLSWSQHFGVEKMADRIRLNDSKRREFGSDLYWTARL